MKTCVIALSVASLAFAAGSAFAQKISPGLWEHQVTMKSSSGQMEAAMAKAQAEMAKMPPEQRKMMEEMMAKHGMSSGGPGKPTMARICVTPEQAARDEPPQDPERRCKTSVLSRSGNTMKYKFSCEGPPPTTGEGEYTMASSKSYSGRTVITSTPKGKAETMEVQTTGTWVGADCGALKKP